MICFAEIDVLATCRGQACCKLSPDKSAAHRDTAAEYPDAEDQKRRVNAVRYLGRIREDSCANDAAHHDHRGIE